MRKAISKKTRFEVFKRDGFCCQYCSSRPPSVPLEIDHIIPVSKGGENDIDNLITACFECNRGKSDNELTNVPETISIKIETKKLALEQYKQYKKILDKERKQMESDVSSVEDVYSSYYEGWGFSDKFRVSVKKFIKYLGSEEVIDSMETACNVIYYSENKALKYFCGICWNKIKER